MAASDRQGALYQDGLRLGQRVGDAPPLASEPGGCRVSDGDAAAGGRELEGYSTYHLKSAVESRCGRCRGRLFRDEPDTLACLVCGNRVYLSAPEPWQDNRRHFKHIGASRKVIERELRGEAAL